MSHVADVDIKVRDLDALDTAVQALGGELVREQKTHKWYGRFLNDWSSDRAAVNRRDPKTFGKCDHAIKFPGVDYEIGLCKEEDGSFTAVYDNYGSGRMLEERCGGIGLPKLKDEYAAAVTTRVLARKGFRCTRTIDAKGRIAIKAMA
jgi:hypothetical protein